MPKRTMTSDEIARDFPAKFSKRILDEITLALEDTNTHTVFDPFGGVGGVHDLRDYGYETYAIELEPEWARTSKWTYVGNALRPRTVKTIDRLAPFDAIVTSPSYGNRMADHHHAKDACGHCIDGMVTYRDALDATVTATCPKCGGLGLSKRNTYAHRLRAAAGDQDRELHPDNSGGMQWGEEYRDLHVKAWGKAVPLLRPGGLFVLNISDHYRGTERMKVSGFHVETLTDCGLVVEDIVPIATPRNRNGSNAHLRVDAELVVTFRKPKRR